MFISLFFSFFVAAAFASPSSPSSATSTIASPQPTATVAATAAAAAERVISRDVDEVEVIPKRRRGRSIPPPPTTAAGASRRGWEGSDSMGGRMARGARFALAASNPPPPRGRSRRRRVRWWTCAPVIEGGKSCKKNPRHSAPTSSALFLSFSLSRSFRRFLPFIVLVFVRLPPVIDGGST